MRQFHLTKSLNGQLKLTPFVALTPRPSDDLKDKESDQAPREVLKAEYQTYQTIAKRLKEHPESLHADALATAHFIDLGDARSFIAQKHYDGSLKDSTWTTDQTESGKVWVLETLASLSQGLAQLHKIGLVHGDIKEENVLMDKKTGKVVLTDFGLTYDPKKEGIKGATAQYLSPGCLFCSYAKVPAFKSTLEDFQKTDIFAFGLMALHTVPSFRSDSLYYRCEAEIKDFAKKGCDQTLNQDITKSASILYSQVRKIAREACKGKSATSCKEKIIADCLNPDPALRPTAEELKRRFEQALALSQP
jgi:serine/threonine protein kinase